LCNNWWASRRNPVATECKSVILLLLLLLLLKPMMQQVLAAAGIASGF
jgi:hypothetical protein